MARRAKTKMTVFDAVHHLTSLKLDQERLRKDLKSLDDEINSLESVLRRQFIEPVSSTIAHPPRPKPMAGRNRTSSVAGQPRRKPGRPKGVVETIILDKMRKSGGKTTSADLKKVFNDPTGNKFYNAITRMVKQKVITRVQPGEYELSSKQSTPEGSSPQS